MKNILKYYTLYVFNIIAISSSYGYEVASRAPCKSSEVFIYVGYCCHNPCILFVSGERNSLAGHSLNCTSHIGMRCRIVKIVWKTCLSSPACVSWCRFLLADIRSFSSIRLRPGQHYLLQALGIWLRNASYCWFWRWYRAINHGVSKFMAESLTSWCWFFILFHKHYLTDPPILCNQKHQTPTMCMPSYVYVHVCWCSTCKNVYFHFVSVHSGSKDE